jgi:hypothetical protein
MLVYRIQDSCGAGPYTSTRMIDHIHIHHNEIAHDPDSRVPAPEREGLGYVRSYHRFGFTSLEQLDRWFTPEEQAALYREGFELVVFNLPDHTVELGQHQCRFLREDLCTP